MKLPTVHSSNSACFPESLRSEFWKVLYGVLAILSFEALLFLWRSHVEPSPDYQYPEFFSNYINYLVISKYLGNDWNTIIKLGFDSDYPLGFAVFPWLISGWNIQNIFISNPWLWNLFMTIPLALLPIFTNWNKKQTLVYFLLIFFCPCTQVMLKGFNPQSPIIVYALCALALLLGKRQDKNKARILAFLIFSGLAISIKHMGAFYFVIIFMCLIAWQFLRYQSALKEICLGLLLVLICMPAYPLEGLKFYLAHVVTSHNPFLSMWAFLVYLGLSLVAVALVLCVLRKKQGKAEFPDLFNSDYFVIISLVTWFLIPWLQISRLQSVIFSGIIVLLMILISVYLVKCYDCTSEKALKGLIAFYLIGFSSAMYLSLVGHTPYIFMLSVSFSVYLFIDSNKINISAIMILIIFLIISNFFPSHLTMRQKFEDADYYTRLFITEIQNPLGWQRNPLKNARQELIKILESYHYSPEQYEEGIKIGCIDLDLDMFAFLYDVQNHFPNSHSNKILPEELFRKNLQNLILNQDTEFLNADLKSGEIPIFIYRSIPANEIQALSKETFSDFQKNVLPHKKFWEMEEDLIRIIILHLNQSPEILRNYRRNHFRMGDHIFEVLVHKSLKLRTKAADGPNYYLQKLLKNRH